jgi:RHS repeat-associated protein
LALEVYGTQTQRFLWGPNTDQLLATEYNGGYYGGGHIYFPLADAQGTIHDVAKFWLQDAQTQTYVTTVVMHRQIDAFGRDLGMELFTGHHFGVETTYQPYAGPLFVFTGRYLDPLTELQNNHHRWYAPELGRWMSEDPLGFAAGDANLNRYVGNAVTTQLDPSGGQGLAAIMLAPAHEVRVRIAEVPMGEQVSLQTKVELTERNVTGQLQEWVRRHPDDNRTHAQQLEWNNIVYWYSAGTNNKIDAEKAFASAESHVDSTASALGFYADYATEAILATEKAQKEDYTIMAEAYYNWAETSAWDAKQEFVDAEHYYESAYFSFELILKKLVDYLAPEEI